MTPSNVPCGRRALRRADQQRMEQQALSDAGDDARSDAGSASGYDPLYSPQPGHVPPAFRHKVEPEWSEAAADEESGAAHRVSAFAALASSNGSVHRGHTVGAQNGSRLTVNPGRPDRGIKDHVFGQHRRVGTSAGIEMRSSPHISDGDSPPGVPYGAGETGQHGNSIRANVAVL